MKTVAKITVALVLGIALIGCSVTSKTITAKSQGERTDVFREVTEGDPIPAGYADVIIKANIKTHIEGYYAGESKKTVHGKPAYPFLINIDGQAALWDAPGVSDRKPAYGKDGKTSLDPEAGEGMKYLLEKKVRLAAGTHSVFLGLSEEPYHAATEIVVKDGGSYILEFKPLYRYKLLPARIPSFFQGISSYETRLTESDL
jgi:hypothetical protein